MRRPLIPFAIAICLGASLVLAGCGGAPSADTVAVATIATASMPGLGRRADGPPLGYAARQLRGAVAEGLVALDESGDIVPGAAESWIVTDAGRSYIFRLRDTDWPGGRALAAGEVRADLRRTIAALGGTTLALDLAPIRDIRALTDRVIEIRLTSPMPDFLQLLAQPELGLHPAKGAAGLGPLRRTGGGATARLAPRVRPGLDDGAGDGDDDGGAPPPGRASLTFRTLPPEQAVAAFRDQTVAAIFDGRLQDWPLADPGPLSRGTVRLDPALGLFGLAFLDTDGLLGTPERREALSMAIDRAALFDPFGIGGVQPATRVVPDGIGAPGAAGGDVAPGWAALPLEQRRAQARRRLAGWRGPGGARPVLRIVLPSGEGGDLLYSGLAVDFAAVGVRLERVRAGRPADLALVDRLARYAAPRWFLDQFNCRVSRVVCSPAADILVARAVAEPDAAAGAALIAQAQAALDDAQAFIPLAAPVRWSLVRGSLGGFAENRWGWHPLPPILAATTSP